VIQYQPKSVKNSGYWSKLFTVEQGQVAFIYKTRQAEIFSPSNKIYRDVGRAKDLSAPLHIYTHTHIRTHMLHFVGQTVCVSFRKEPYKLYHSCVVVSELECWFAVAVNTELLLINPFVRIDLNVQTHNSKWPPCDYICAAGCQSVAFPVCLMPPSASRSHSINCCCFHRPDLLHCTLCVVMNRRQRN